MSGSRVDRRWVERDHGSIQNVDQCGQQCGHESFLSDEPHRNVRSSEHLTGKVANV